ncbi:hypothetical protein B0H13DRAFT_1910619 [Mycena leptocephala]|nr:hypothetical protein B0H13DRAFT_1910619 [Mycena leptocephala]
MNCDNVFTARAEEASSGGGRQTIFLRRRRCALEQELAVLKGTMRLGSTKKLAPDWRRLLTQFSPLVHESLFWRLDAYLTRITDVLSAERAGLRELRDLYEQDRRALEKLGLQVNKLYQTVDGLKGAMGMLRCAVEEPLGRKPATDADEDSSSRSGR